jgi:hypothetical protein
LRHDVCHFLSDADQPLKRRFAKRRVRHVVPCGQLPSVKKTAQRSGNLVNNFPLNQNEKLEK